MKRSRSIALTAMGVSALALTACGDSGTRAAVYQTVEQCMTDKKFTQSECRNAMVQAKGQHAQVAPKYRKVEDCEADFGAGNCEYAPYRTRSGRRVYMPIMAGYMFGRRIKSGRTVATQPLYRSGDDRRNFRTANNVRVTSKTGLVGVPKSTTRAPAPKLRAVARGGFGEAANRRTMRAARGRSRSRSRSFGG